jgi:hypothetical protein
MDFCRAKTVRIGKWRWPPPKEDGTPGTAEGFFEFKMRKMKEKGWPQIHSCNIVIFLYLKYYLDIISNSDEFCASFLAVPRRFTIVLSSLAYFLQFQISPQTRVSKCLCRCSSKRKFSKYLEAAVALQSCT